MKPLPGSWILNAGPRSTTISPDRETSFSFDLEGRPLSWLERDVLHRRSLASEVHGRSGRGAGRKRWRLSPDEAATAFTAVLDRAAAAPREGIDLAITTRLDGILEWSAARLLAEAGRFEETYHPVSILPPDQYRAIVLQATLGCTWNRCAFCSFYQDRPFTARSAEEFRDHAADVAALLGRGALLRDRIFLADGDALVLTNDRLRPLLAVARETFPGRPLAGFVEVHTGARKTAADWREAREDGLETVCIGLESGHDPLLRFLDKPGSADEALAFVRSLKEARLRVALVVLCGAGGDRFAQAHERDTLDLIGRLPLEEGDLVYLSPFVEWDGSAYAARARADGVQPVDDAAIEAQLERLRAAVRERHPAVKAARYDIREFLY